MALARAACTVLYVGWRRDKLGDKMDKLAEAQQEYDVIQRWHGGVSLQCAHSAHAVQKLGLAIAT